VPRLTDARRELRRSQITLAALRCFARDGFERTSIADIAAESGLSTGSIYSHYAGKADLVTAVVGGMLDRKSAVIDSWAAGDHPPHPDEVASRLAGLMGPEKARVAVQTWGRATTDPSLRAIVTAMSDGLRDLLLDYTTAWLAAAGNRDAAAPIVRRAMALYQSEVLRAALLEEARHD
jgi:AcrR family transcriptional regulator